jgi:hypothetical protein
LWHEDWAWCWLKPACLLAWRNNSISSCLSTEQQFWIASVLNL